MMQSATHARRILSAWNSSDLAAIQAELAQAERYCSDALKSSLEGERRELLDCVVKELRGSVERAGAALALLKHLSRAADDPIIN